MGGIIRQLEERLLSNEVMLMRWSPNMDLLAIANVKGELALHRLTWQRVWLLSPIEESDKITNIAWRPDGKLIAITYQNSKFLCLIDIENKNIEHKTKLMSNDLCTCMSWLSLTPLGSNNIINERVSPTSCTGEYLPPLPNLNRSFSQEPERKELVSQTLDMLFLGQENGNIMMYIFGMFYCGLVTIGNGPVLDISGGSGKALWASWKNNDCVTVVRLSCLLLQNSDAFLKVAQIQAHIEYLMDYLSRTIMAISEAWETILLEMDEKLAKYAEGKAPGSVAADFLELLMIGVPTPELVSFLLRDLTEKGLKKLGHSIEMCYSNIQKLVLKHLSSVGMALIYHLAEMRGMVRFGGEFEALGLKDENSISDALGAAQSFLAKSSEVQQVIEQSVRDYKAFIRWLYVVILRLNDEKAPTEMCKVSQQDLTYIAEFLRGFDKIEINASKRKGVNLERLGQYLRQEPMQTCFSPEGSEWAAMLVENKSLQKHSLIIHQDFESSLFQAHSNLVEAMNKVFVCAYQDLTTHFKQKVMPLVSVSTNFTSQITTTEGNLLIAVSDSEHKYLQLFKIIATSGMEPLVCKVIKIDINDTQGSAIPSSTNPNVIPDVEFYSVECLSFLLTNKESNLSCFLMLPLNHYLLQLAQDKKSETVFNLKDLTDLNSAKKFQDTSAKTLVVSGARKVVAILSENRRKIRLLETEVEEEEEHLEEQEIVDNMMDITPTSTSLS